MQPAIGGKSLYRCDLLWGSCANRSDTGASGITVNENGASPALSFAAAVFAAGKVELVAQDREKARLRLCIYGIEFPIHL